MRDSRGAQDGANPFCNCKTARPPGLWLQLGFCLGTLRFGLAGVASGASGFGAGFNSGADGCAATGRCSGAAGFGGSTTGTSGAAGWGC